MPWSEWHGLWNSPSLSPPQSRARSGEAPKSPRVLSERTSSQRGPFPGLHLDSCSPILRHWPFCSIKDPAEMGRIQGVPEPRGPRGCYPAWPRAESHRETLSCRLRKNAKDESEVEVMPRTGKRHHEIVMETVWYSLESRGQKW